MTLASARALVIGAGGLGCPSALGLAAAGVGTITILDDDRVDPTNLSRQMLYGENDVGRAKAGAAAEALRLRFPGVRIEAVSSRFGHDDSTRALVRAHDIVLDGSDNFATRFAANDLCVELGVPLVHGAAIRWQGQVLTILPGRSPCLRCVFEAEPPPGAAPTCAEAGVIAPLVGIVGGWMATEALAVLRGERPSTAGAMRVLDAWAARERFARVGPDPTCSARCGAAEFR